MAEKARKKTRSAETAQSSDHVKTLGEPGSQARHDQVAELLACYRARLKSVLGPTQKGFNVPCPYDVTVESPEWVTWVSSKPRDFDLTRAANASGRVQKQAANIAAAQAYMDAEAAAAQSA